MSAESESPEEVSRRWSAVRVVLVLAVIALIVALLCSDERGIVRVLGSILRALGRML